MSDILPDEVIAEILLRLPVKSIGRARCVSKPWLSLLTQAQKLLLLCSPHSLFALALQPGGFLSRKLESFDEIVATLVGSCNGLVLVLTETNVKCLINCLTEEYFKLPDSPLALDPSKSFSMHGFGYDSLSDDYKIVSLSVRKNDNTNAFVDIYSLKMRSWMRIGTSPYGYKYYNEASGLFFNGALHWMLWKSSYNEPPVIVAFDLSSEKFNEILAPVSIYKSKFWLNKLMVIDGCLGIAVAQSPNIFSEIWYMKSYSMVDSWTELVIDMEFKNTWWPHCFHQDKLLFSEADEILKWYYLQDGRVEVCLAEDDDKPNFKDGIIYSESLVSPHFNYHN